MHGATGRLRFEDDDDERVAVEATINQARHLLVSEINIVWI
jgi:hypothetical protein